MSADNASAASEQVRRLLLAVCAGLELEAAVEIDERDGEITATLIGDDLERLIGRNGRTIDAVQHLAYKVAVQGDAGPRRVVVDANGYRERRRAILTRQADQAADSALESDAPVALDAMNAGERKLVHEYLKDRMGIETYSEGSEPDRHLVVAPLRST